jgi:hypothetical protein
MRPQANDADAPLRLWPRRSRSGRPLSGSRSPGTQDYETKPKTLGGCPRGSREVDVRGRGRRAFPPGLAVPELARRRVEGASTAVPWRGARARRRSYPVPRAKARPGVQVPVRLLTVPELGGPGRASRFPSSVIGAVSGATTRSAGTVSWTRACHPSRTRTAALPSHLRGGTGATWNQTIQAL